METAPATPEERPTLAQRWLGVLPLILSLGIWVLMAETVLDHADVFSQLRVNMPKPARVAFFLVEQLEKVWPFTLSALLLFALHFGWGCRTTQRLLWVNIAWMLLLLLVVFVFFGGSLMCMAKIVEAMVKK
jgi:hypothetical protein